MKENMLPAKTAIGLT